MSRRSVRKRRHVEALFRTVRVNGVTYDPASVRITFPDGTVYRGVEVGLRSVTYEQSS